MPAGWRLYALALIGLALALTVTGALLPVTDEPAFAPLVGTVGLIAIFLGAGPALAGTVVGWTAAWFMYAEPAWSFGSASSDATRWGVGLAFAVLLIWASWTLQRLREREATRAERAEKTSAVARGLHELAAALTSAATPAEVAGALLTGVPDLLRASGGSLGLVEGDRLVVVDPAGGPRPALRPGLGLPLTTRAPITAAARTGATVFTATRDDFERDFPDGARLAPYAASALAVPLRVQGRVAGAIGFPFTRPDAIDENVLSLAEVAAELGSQTLERSLAYERERTARDGLERVTRLMPRFADQPAEAVAGAICSEAREMFECDVVQLWKVGNAGLEVLWREPPSADAPVGRIEEAQDYPGMQRSLEGLGTTFVPDAREIVSGAALERVLAEGIRSVLRIPIVVAGRAELMLALRWERIVPEPTAQTLALARRFADHAGLVVEQGERRRAEATEQLARARAERLASDLAQLHALATALGGASTPSEVAAVVTERALAVVAGAVAAIYDTHSGSPELLASLVADDALLVDGGTADPLEEADLHGEATRARAPVWIDEPEEGDRLGVTAIVPMLVEGSSVGLLVVCFRRGRVPDDGTRRLVETIAGQAAQPFERSRILEREHAARVAAEISAGRTRRLQALTAGFSGALTPAEVAAAFLEETLDAVGASAAALGVLDDDGRELHVVGAREFPEAFLGQDGVLAVAEAGPASNVLRLQRPAFYSDMKSLLASHPGVTVPETTLESFAFLPLSAGAGPLGIAALGWSRPGHLVDDERVFLEAVAAQCGLALDRARRYEGERVVAETLQRSFLPETLPAMEGVRVAALYLPGSTAVDVGGDWFDTLTLADGRLGFVVGDVVGKGVRAASTMGQLRNGMRALTLDDLTPAETVTKLNLLLQNYIDVPFATLAYLAFDPATREVTIVSAGHPPPLVVTADGRTEFLEGAGGLPLGVDTAIPYTEHSVTLEADSIVVLYTDGLVERRGRSIDDGLADLARVAARAPRDADGFVDVLVEELIGGGSRHDDVAILSILLDKVPLAPLELAVPAQQDSLPRIRRELAQWLDTAAVSELDARDIVLAAWEAGANAIEHAGTDRDSLVRIEAELSGDRVRIGVRDAGRWKEPEPRQDRGLGLRLIEALMATVDIDRSSEGTRIMMERPLTREPARMHGANPADD